MFGTVHRFKPGLIGNASERSNRSRARCVARHKRRSRLQVELLEQRRLLAAFQNPILSQDVDGDGWVESVDALLVVNDLNRNGVRNVAELPSDTPFLNTSGDDLIEPYDVLQVINLLNLLTRDTQPPVVFAGLEHDTARWGTTNSDGITTNATINGQATDSNRANRLTVSLDGGSPVSIPIDADGSFTWTPPLASDGSDDGEHIVAFVATDLARNPSDPVSVAFMFDTQAPAINGDLASGSDSEPRGDQITSQRFVNLAGATDPGAEVRVDGEPLSVADDGSFLATGLEIPLANRLFQIESSDVAGNVGLFPLTIAREIPQGTVLAEVESQANYVDQSIPLALDSGSRTVVLDLGLDFGPTVDNQTEDVFAVYLVSSDGQTLLDRGRPGTPMVAISGTQKELANGLVSFDGRFATIDVSSANASNGFLRYQWIDRDGVADAVASVELVENQVELYKEPNQAVGSAFAIVSAAAAVEDLELLQGNTDLYVETRNTRFDSGTGTLTAEVRVRNLGDALGRQMVLAFETLPEAATLVGASGQLENGVPYLNLINSLPFGGLGTGQAGEWLEVVIENPNNTPFAWQPTLLSGGPNAAPQWQPLDPLVIAEGGNSVWDLPVEDADGDPVSISVRAPDGAPPLELLPGKQLRVTPRPGDAGTYSLTLLASDGAETARLPIEIDVRPDGLSTTRVSGQVIDVDGTPLDAVPVQVGRHQAVTDTAGNFQIEVPSFLVPTPHFDIAVPEGDPSFDPMMLGDRVIELQRLGYLPGSGTSSNNPRQHPNLVSAFLDASAVYGADSERAAALRFGDGTGRMKIGEDGLLPRNNTEFFPTGMLENDNSSLLDPATMYVAGDVRASENPSLTALHTVLVREHNRRADQLAAEHPDWNGEQLFQHARRWVTALMQHITYQEFLPVMLGGEAIQTYGGYQPSINPQVSGLFSGAAFRVGHSMSPADVWRMAEDGSDLEGGPLSLREAFFNPQPLATDGLEAYLRGMLVQPVEEVDTAVRDELRNFLFGPPGAGGLDLAAINIQRGRDMGLPSYNQARIDVGLQPVTSFAEITADADMQTALAAVYGTVADIDIWVGGLAEDHVDGAMVGPLFAEILRDGFERLRAGDRFWYENGRLTPDELEEMRETTLADVLERTTDLSAITGSPFMAGTPAPGPAPGGEAADELPGQHPAFSGLGNNVGKPSIGAAGSPMLIDYALGYEDGISSPGGTDRPSARLISNELMAQPEVTTNAVGATTMLMIWGQIIAHDLTLSASGMEDTLQIFGDARQGDADYPFVAEKIPDLLGHDAFYGSANEMGRPIYLPKLNTTDAVVVDPNQDTLVSINIDEDLPNVEILIKAGTVRTRSGDLYDGPISITRVPPFRTPAALPINLEGSAVITVQPAGLIFTEPAEITFPNYSELEPGEETDYWQVNPDTAQFEPVAKMRVSDDGTVLETFEGGLTATSWGSPPPPPPTLDLTGNIPHNKDGVCAECEASIKTGSSVELHTGAYREWHDLVSYQSQGTTRGLQLTYNSLHADPRHTLHFQLQDVPSGLLWAEGIAARGTADSGERILAESSYQQQSTDLINDILPQGHFWDVPSRQDVLAGLLFDFNNLESGLYVSELTVGGGRLATGPICPAGPGICLSDIYRTILPRFSSFEIEGIETVVVNRSDGPFGSGWSVPGLQELIPHLSSKTRSITGEPLFTSVVLLDGNEELVFRYEEGEFVSPPGDFSELVFDNTAKTFQRTLKDGTVYRFDEQNRLQEMEDRKGNRTVYEYADGLISTITDPVGLETVFESTARRITSIIDPAGRRTSLEYDIDGNLTQITDPDNSTRQFSYDARHHLTEEINKRGHVEKTVYNFMGRVEAVIHPDGTQTSISPLQSQGVFPPAQTKDYRPSAKAVRPDPPLIDIFDENGNLESVAVDRAGQYISSSDGEGPKQQVSRNKSNLITSILDARGNIQNYSYDQSGNAVQSADTFAGGVDSGAVFFERVITGSNFVSDSQTLTAIGDLNSDGVDDFIMATFNNRPATMATQVQVQLGSGVGTFRQLPVFEIPFSLTHLEIGEFNQDGILDIIASGSSGVTFYRGMGDGTFRFQSQRSLADTISTDGALRIADVNGDEINDLIYRGRSDEDYFVSMIGNGNFEFMEATRIALPHGSHSDSSNTVRLADIDLDGDLDAAVAMGGVQTSSGDPGSVSGIVLLENDSTGQFQLIETLDVGVPGVASESWNRRHPAGIPNLTFADVNGDEWVDLVAAGSSSFGVYTLLNDGAGRFQDPVHTTIDDPNTGEGRALPSSVELIDIDGDNILDAVVSASRILNDRGVNYPGYGKQMFVMLGEGDGTFTPEHTNVTPLLVPRKASLIQLDEDQPALVVAETSRLMRSEIIPLRTRPGTTSFDLNAVDVAGGSTKAIVDLDSDGQLDIIWATLTNVDWRQQTWTLNTWSQPIEGTAEQRRLLESFDGTGHVYESSETHVYADHFDDDNQIDLVVAVEQEEVRILWSTDSAGQFDPSTAIHNANGIPFEILEPIDFDGDQQLDLIVYDKINGTYQSQGPAVRLVKNSGERMFVAEILTDYSNSTWLQDLAVGDVDGDQILDLVAAFHTHNDSLKQVHFFPGDGSGGVAAASVPLSPAPENFPDPSHVAVADLNGDGKGEIIHNAGGRRWTPQGRLSIWEWNNEAWADEALHAASTRFHPTIFDLEGQIDIADLNQDGALDIVVSGKRQGGLHAVGYLLNDGRGSFGRLTRLELADSSEPILDVQILDVLGSELPEIVVSQASRVTILENFGGLSVGLPAQMDYEEEYGLITRQVDELGRQTIYDRDSATGNLLHEIQVVGSLDASLRSGDDIVTSFTYTASGMVEQIIDPLERVTRFEYDPFDRLVETTYALGTVDEVSMSYSYDSSTVAGLAGLVTSMIDERGNVTEYRYDSMNRLTRIIEPDPDGPGGPLISPQTSFVFDAAGNVTRVVDAAGVSTTTRYDKLDRVTSISDPSGTVRQQYDRAGNLVTVIDPLGNVTEYEYDTRDRLVAMVDAEGGVTSYEYDFNNNLITLIDPVENTTRFFYDERDRLIREIDPLGNAIGYEYDAVDNLIRKTDRNDRVTEYSYDELDRLTTETWVEGGNEITYEYDKVGNLRAVDDIFSGLDFEYDKLDRNIEVDNADTPDAPHVVLNYSYDPSGNVTAVTDTIYGDGGTVTGGATTSYDYDALHRLTQLNQTGQNVSEKRVDFVYNQIGQYTQLDRYSDLAGTQPVVSTTYQYDNANRLIDLRHSNAVEDIAFYEYTYDDSSRIKSINSVDGLVEYSYDDTSQLTAADYSNESRTDESYTYDKNGNRLNSHLHGNGYVTDKANRLISDGTYNYKYDKEGNQVRRTEIATGAYREFIWDNRNRLVAITDYQSDGTSILEVEFTYDAFDRRIAKAVDQDPSDTTEGSVTHFIYDREDVLLDFVDPDGVSGNAATTLDQRYLHGAGIDQVFAQENDGGREHWLMTDHLSTVRELVTSDGQIVNVIRYDSYGNPEFENSPAITTRYFFQSRELDRELDLMYFRSRYYDPSIGLFSLEDTIGHSSVDHNLYRFVFNRPNVFRDPFGENPAIIALIIGAIALAAGDCDGLSDFGGALENSTQSEEERRLIDENDQILKEKGTDGSFDPTYRENQKRIDQLRNKRLRNAGKAVEEGGGASYPGLPD